jgi:hypothetical protein
MQSRDCYKSTAYSPEIMWVESANTTSREKTTNERDMEMAILKKAGQKVSYLTP